MQIDGQDIWEARDEAVESYIADCELSYEERHTVEKILDMFIARLIVKSRL